MNFGNWLVLIIFVGVPLLQWIAQKVKEARQQAQAREAIRRRQEEAMRTGRTAEDDRREAQQRADAHARLEASQREAMLKRQEQLRELRRKQMQAQAEARARARQTQPTRPRSTTTARVPQQQPSPRPTRTAPLPQNRYSQPSPPAQRSRPPQPPPAKSTPLERPGGTRPSDFERITLQRQAEAARRQAILQAQSADEDARGEDAVRPMLARMGGLRAAPNVAAPDATHATTSGADLLANLDADDWRRGIVLAEVLGKPIALRDADAGSVWL